MIDNFLQDSYHSYDEVYIDQETHHSIFIGDVQSALDLEFLKTKNIKTVVTAARDMDHVSYDDDIFHIVYPLLDGKNEDIATFFDSFYELVQSNITKGSVLVHCAAGISRSSTLVLSYLMKKQKMGFKQAIALVRKSRPTVLPNLGFERQLKKYEEFLKKGIKNSRSSRRHQVKTSQSGKSHLLIKTQLLPMLGALGKYKPKEKLMSANVKNLIDKITDKDAQVLKAYNNSTQNRNESKNKKFIISKKSTSFTRHQDERDGIRTAHPEPADMHGSSKNIERDRNKRILKTPLQEMKDIYLSKKGNAYLERRYPTERGHTFYNLRLKHKIEM